MKITVDSIGVKALELEESIPVASWDMDSFDIRFVDDIAIKYKILRAEDEIIISARVTTQREIICSRCLEKTRQTVSQNFNKRYPLEKLDQYLETDTDIREEILLNFPLKVLCKPDCKGVCPECGVNLNQRECRCYRKDKASLER